MFYLFGDDKQSRPIVIFQARLFDESDHILTALAFLFESVRQQVLIPYYVENWTVIIDFDGESLAHLSNVKYNSRKKKLAN